ncbi:protein FAM163B [Rousettus aegyptiacus]|uniref:Family with sequence similarity 163 member B n=1 Tax=Rousettus aegyptiacus TaxID=9407 RepID=A0A7J8IJ94_ROUAE|nr:protein FAM163B [Rousettus aegyptiacus]XP_015992428.1 protein FAM163B [Rousettus aegyptiacus]XP_015992429.1 protein FAM163B [Rousettus aegyptiacus]XP_036074107.1 protein FAM163B [Rousettus aegyptiacus]KAF6484300.1 family with sequence similarity 163 member B [Rousettus aegyptiacus]
MTAGTVVITGGILATVILLCIIAVLCYCRLQYYCCKRDQEDPEEDEEPDFAVHPSLPPLHSSRSLVLTNGPALHPAAAPAFGQKSPQARALCRSCSHHEPPAFFLQEPEDGGVHNGGQRVAYHSLGADDLELPPGTFGGLQALNPNRLSAMREAFSRSRSVSTDV